MLKKKICLPQPPTYSHIQAWAFSPCSIFKRYSYSPNTSSLCITQRRALPLGKWKHCLLGKHQHYIQSMGTTALEQRGLYGHREQGSSRRPLSKSRCCLLICFWNCSYTLYFKRTSTNATFHPPSSTKKGKGATSTHIPHEGLFPLHAANGKQVNIHLRYAWT